jgi:hypothetical protein
MHPTGEEAQNQRSPGHDAIYEGAPWGTSALPTLPGTERGRRTAVMYRA